MITSEFPINLKFISGPSTISNFIPEFLTIHKISQENVIIGCSIDNSSKIQSTSSSSSSYNLKKLHVTPEMTLIKCYLEFEDEQRMLASQNVQNILKFCQFNCDHFLKMIVLENLSKSQLAAATTPSQPPERLKNLLRKRKKNVTTTTSAHEKEDSIIFISKNDLDNLEIKMQNDNSIQQQQQQQINQTKITDKMKVFQSTKKKWFKLLNNTNDNNKQNSLNINEQMKRMSMERYNDMSKLLQERFGNNDTSNNAIFEEEFDERPTSEIGCITDKRFITTSQQKQQIHKSLSLQDVVPDVILTNNILENFQNSTSNINNFDEEEEEENKQISNYKLNAMSNSNNEIHQKLKNCHISEKMYSEFHVKTKQYSKSSSSLHQLLNFAIPRRNNNNKTIELNKKRK